MQTSHHIYIVVDVRGRSKNDGWAELWLIGRKARKSERVGLCDVPVVNFR
jgi:hypothetical protein